MADTDGRHLIPDPRALIPDPQPPISDPQSPIPDPRSPIPDPQSPTPRLRHQILYAFGSLGGNALFLTYTLWFAYFYAPPADRGLTTYVPIVTLGLILGVIQLVELVDGPLIGYLSDRTRSRLGRRTPYVLFGAPALALAFFLLWIPPHAEPTPWNAVYLAASVLVFLVAFTVVMGPYDALFPEIAVTPRARVTLASIRAVTGAGGALIGLVASGPLVDAVGFQAMAGVIGCVALVSYALALLGVRGARERALPSSLALRPSLAATLQNRPFCVLVLSLGLLLLGQGLLVRLIPYFSAVVLGAPEAGVALLMGALMFVVMLTLPALIWLAGRWGTKRVASLAALVLGLYLPTLGLVGLGFPAVPALHQGIIAVGLMGIPIAALYVFPNALLADVADYDAERSGQRREGLYFGMFATLTKLASVLSAWLFGSALGLFGFSGENPLGVRLTPLLAGGCVLLGWAIFHWGYPDLSPGRAAAGVGRDR